MLEIKSFNDVDNALKRLCEISLAMQKASSEATLAINELKEQAKRQLEPLELEKDFIEQTITMFCEDNKHEFAQKRSKEFVFGKVAYKLSNSVSLPRIKAKVESLLKAIKSYGLAKECIIYKEELNKEALAQLQDDELVKLGLKRVVKDNFRIEPNLSALR
ncbi:MAG: host-nuclease inhibitor Gam family protein [Helicobacteraceae bacterium]